MSVQEVKEAIKEFSDEELEELERYIADTRFAAWDNQLESDSHAGRLNQILEQARASYKRGEGTAL